MATSPLLSAVYVAQLTTFTTVLPLVNPIPLVPRVQVGALAPWLLRTVRITSLRSWISVAVYETTWVCQVRKPELVAETWLRTLLRRAMCL